MKPHFYKQAGRWRVKHAMRLAEDEFQVLLDFVKYLNRRKT